jgi:hypothetical protein
MNEREEANGDTGQDDVFEVVIFDSGHCYERDKITNDLKNLRNCI